jgi:hypothetical protein
MFLSKSAFAARIGKSPSYITWLKDNNRLVLSDTEARILETADPSKAAVVARHQQDRIQRDVHSQLSSQAEPTFMAAPQPMAAAPGKQPDFQKARAHREYYLAQMAEMEFHKAQGSTVDVADVQSGAYTAGRMLRDTLLSLPPQVAPELASMSDPWEIERYLVAALRRVFIDAQRMSSDDFGQTVDANWEVVDEPGET